MNGLAKQRIHYYKFTQWRGGRIMPKMKSHRGAAKRFRIKKSGLIKRSKANRSHILTKKSPKRKRHLRKATYLTPGDAKVVKLMIKR